MHPREVRRAVNALSRTGCVQITGSPQKTKRKEDRQNEVQQLQRTVPPRYRTPVAERRSSMRRMHPVLPGLVKVAHPPAQLRSRLLRRGGYLDQGGRHGQAENQRRLRKRLCGERESHSTFNRCVVRSTRTRGTVMNKAEKPAETVCPKCKGPLQDYRHAGFNPESLRQQRTCYQWTESEYTCNGSIQRILSVEGTHI